MLFTKAKMSRGLISHILKKLESFQKRQQTTKRLITGKIN